MICGKCRGLCTEQGSYQQEQGEEGYEWMEIIVIYICDDCSYEFEVYVEDYQ